MKTLLFAAVLTLSAFNNPQPKASFRALYALAGGTWQMKTKTGAICERWKKINANELHSQGFKVTGHDTIWLEKVQLVHKGNDIYYIPTVTDENAGKPVSFKLTSTKNGQFVFENPGHDFPQRVVYQFITPDSLHAWVDGTIKGKLKKQHFYYKRVN